MMIVHTLRPFARRTATIVGIVAAALALCEPRPAAASSFNVNPTQVVLSARVPTRTVTIRNDSERALRFQVSAYTWTQDSSGQMQLSATTDVIFFPALLTLAPREERRVRVGLSTGFTDAEKTYRLFVEELPQAERPDDPPRDGVTVLTKIGIPIFAQPARPFARVTLGNLALAHGAFRFDVTNVGNVHFVPTDVRLRGIDRDGGAVLERALSGWYILAGGLRAYEAAIPSAACARLASVLVEVRFGQTLLSERLQLPQASCGP
jgi:fimbrial chaperone protein